MFLEKTAETGKDAIRAVSSGSNDGTWPTCEWLKYGNAGEQIIKQFDCRMGCVLGLSRETESIEYILMCRYVRGGLLWELAHTIMEAEKSYCKLDNQDSWCIIQSE